MTVKKATSGTSPRSAPRQKATAARSAKTASGRKPVRGALTRAKVGEIFERLQAKNPEPKTELHYENAFQLLIAVILSAQATDVSVNKATGPLFKVAGTAKAIQALGEAGLKEYIKTIGLFNAKAANVIKTCGFLLDRHDGVVPGEREALEQLPGVGRKTANVILNTAFGQPTMAVDTHIFRVGNRTGMAASTTPLGVELQLLKVIPQSYLLNAHHWLILHGRYVCVARKPLCGECIIADLCRFKDKTGPSQ